MSDLYDRGDSEFPEGRVRDRPGRDLLRRGDGRGGRCGRCRRWMPVWAKSSSARSPIAHNLAHLLWTARCTVPSHGLLGTFETRELAEDAKRAHLLLVHGHATNCTDPVCAASESGTCDRACADPTLGPLHVVLEPVLPPLKGPLSWRNPHRMLPLRLLAVRRPSRRALPRTPSHPNGPKAGTH